MHKNILLLVNPVSGKGKNIAITDKIIANFNHENWQFFLFISEYKSHISSFLQKTDLGNFTHIGVVGGDGTMHEVVNGLMRRADKIQIPIVLFPCGTGNSFNYDLGCFTVENALKRLAENKTKKIDIMLIKAKNECFYAFNVVGYGIVNDINLCAESMRWLGGLRYSVAAILEIFKNSNYIAKVQIDEKSFDENFCFVLILNTIHTGKAMKMAPKASLSDGLLDVLVVKHLSVWQLLSLFPKIFSGSHIHSPLVQYIHAKSININPKTEQFGNFDGEVKGFSPFEIEIIPLAIEVVC
jgi:YegS/Rv2252/BmrU family lipid kinase